MGAEMIGRAGSEAFWMIDGQVCRCPMDQEVANGRPTFARWECSAEAWSTFRESVFSWVEDVET